ncbi:PAS domain S-box protein [Candidatus Cryosericum odellii]|jgi:PAS domain S-box-containing protein|uniref:histidine kinase n=3 Tax=Candidatus Cryosericum odellii TaxID=2290917 RepID=A0A398DSY6_9BACT|nr:PAS domain S-box protein [Candidatus Cryosericum odellii]RIE15228.1 PAS domain S-box protein [Candidatus Cryosericum odellii]
MTSGPFGALVCNTALLLLLVYVYDLLNAFHWVSRSWIRQVITGIAIGTIGIFVMLMPWTFATGIIFDTRSILLALSGLFFGTIPTIIAILMTSAYRMALGGSGMWTGVLLIVASGAIGLAWRRAQKRQLASLSFWTLYSLGLVVHVVMLALLFTLPLQTALQIIASITFPVLVVFPIATAAYGTLMVERLRREQGAAAVRESESKFRALFEQAAVGVAKAEARTGRLVLFNQHFADLLGYSPEELLGMNLQTITHPDDRAETPRKMEELASGRISSFAQVKRYVRKDGGIIWVNITISPLWAKGDPPDFAMASVEDITNRKRAEEALAISEERYRTLFESMRIGVLYFGPDGVIMSANPAAVSMLGITQGEIVTRRPTEPWWRNIHEDGSEFSAEALPSVQAMRTGEAVHDVIIGIFNEHEQAYHWANVNAIPQFRAGQTSPYQAYVTMEDVTERRAMGRQLAHLASFPAQNPYPVLEMGTDGVVRFANAATTATLARLGLDPDVRQFLPGDAEQLERLRQQCEQYPQAEELVLGKATFYRVIMAPPEAATLRVYAVDITETKTAQSQQERYLSMLDRSLNEIYVFDEESLKFVYVNGAALHNLGYSLAELQQMTPLDIKPAFTRPSFEELLQPLRDGTREVLVFETVHRRKDGTTYPVEVHLQRFQGDGQTSFLVFVNDITDRKRVQAQLLQSQKMEAVGELAGGVAHDFNNMLTGILGNVAIVKESISLNDPLRENIDAIRTAAEEAANLTRGLLTFSRGAMIQPVALDTNASVERTLAVLTQSLPASVTIVNKLQPGVWNVFMDQSQMTQILLNLGVNARDSMEGRGTLTVGTRNTVVDAAYVQAHPFARTGEFVVLSVADTGPGIAPEALQHIFEPFFTTKPVGGGTGLGLSIVYGAAHQIGGWITVQSDPGQGALFEVYLPRLVGQLPPAAVARRAVARPCIGTVLVVEDEPVVSAVVQALLSRAGYNVLVAADGASAVHALEAHGSDVDLILLDMTMPGMTTEEILAEVRRLYPMLPVLLTSGYTSSDAVKHMLADGIVQGFLAKPYETQVLFATVARLMRTTEGGPR